jgi:hypothetical protein
VKVRTLLVTLAMARTAEAQDPFEIQVYDAESAPRGEVGLETHVNFHRIDAASDETHVTFEPHYGLADWAELGAYLQSALTSTGDLSYAGAKLRVKLRWPRRISGVGFGVNTEISAIPERFEPSVWGSEVRPIVDYSAGRLYASVNPILAIDLAGDLAGHPLVEPCAKLAVRASGEVAAGVEAYGAFGPLDDLGSEHVTTALAAIDLDGDWWTLNAGAGYSFGTTDHVLVKLILGVRLARL